MRLAKRLRDILGFEVRVELENLAHVVTRRDELDDGARLAPPALPPPEIGAAKPDAVPMAKTPSPKRASESIARSPRRTRGAPKTSGTTPRRKTRA
jgi:hypothetical protein